MANLAAVNADDGTSALQAFLTPEAMLTPGIAGSVTMMITNSLALNFDISRAWTGLILSFTCGLLVLVATKNLWFKIVFYVLNSLVIFSVALGANGAAAGVKGARTSATQSLLSIVSAASAQDVGSSDALNSPEWKSFSELSTQYALISTAIDTAKKNGSSADEIAKLEQQLSEIDKKRQDALAAVVKQQADHVKNNPNQITGGPNSVINNQKTFFAPWRF